MQLPARRQRINDHLDMQEESILLKQLNEQIASLKLELRHKLNWQQQVQALSRELEQQRRNKEQWAARLEKEKRDVERLEGLSLGALFYTLTGRKEEKLSKEEAEVLQAKLRYEEASDTVAELEQEIAELRRKLANLKHVEDEYNRAIQEKRLLIERLHPALAETLHDLTGQEDEMRANVKELQEAIAAGRTAKNSLGRAEVLLNKAKDWGTFDMLGGGLLSTAMKHTRIDEARTAIHERSAICEDSRRSCSTCAAMSTSRLSWAVFSPLRTISSTI